MTEKTSFDSLIEANRDRSRFSGHGNSIGAAGHRESSLDPDNASALRHPGESVAVNPGPGGFKTITIGAMWDNTLLQKAGFLGRVLGKITGQGVDIDVGCLYELADGTRGALQAFGEKFGALEAPPFIKLTGDERTGDKKGYDESILVRGERWADIKRLLVYLYIYSGAPDWAAVNPRIVVDIPGEQDLFVTCSVHKENLRVCAIGGLENHRNGVMLTNYTEYFPGHEEMDRAFGFGLQWGDGEKRPLRRVKNGK